jgi:hypothetical protein
MKQPSEMKWLLALARQKTYAHDRLQAQRTICRIAELEAHKETMRRLIEKLIDKEATR